VDDKKNDDNKVDDNKFERVDIIFDYGSPITECQPRVMAYSIAVEGWNLTTKQVPVKLTVDTFESTDVRAETRKTTACCASGKSSF
jgi:hypothetical protein